MLGNHFQNLAGRHRPGPWLTVMSGLVLAGCMGSSDSGNREAEATAACGATEVRNLLIEESQSLNMDLSLCFDASEASVKAGRFVEEVDYSNDRLVFTAREVDRPRESQLTVLDPEGRTQLRINVVIRNTSGAAIEARASHLVNERQAILNLREDRRIYDYILDVAYLEEKITWSEKQALMADWDPADQDSFARLDHRLEKTAEVLGAYQEGNAGEAELAAAADSAVRVLPEHGEYGARQLVEVVQAQDSPVPDVSHGTLAYRDRIQAVSRRTGNRNYGDFVGDDWQFNANFQFLAAVTDEETRS